MYGSEGAPFYDSEWVYCEVVYCNYGLFNFSSEGAPYWFYCGCEGILCSSGVVYSNLGNLRSLREHQNMIKLVFLYY